MRIARELHDVVAHHIAVINVQAGSPPTSYATTRPVRRKRSPTSVVEPQVCSTS